MTRPAVLFVCLGNICRSPTAEIVLRDLLQKHQLVDRVGVDSAGTGDWHIGKPPHRPAQDAARRAEFDMSALRARQVRSTDFREFDYILAMDTNNLADLEALCPADFSGTLSCLRDFSTGVRTRDIADPYGGNEQDFTRAFNDIRAATQAFFTYLQARL